MRLRDLFSNDVVIDPQAGAVAVSGLAVDSRAVKPGDLFFALAGAKTDGVRFIDIAGNDEIVLSVWAPRDWTYDLPQGEVLFAQKVLTHGDLQRLVIRAPVQDLHALLAGLDARHLRIEHMFDY